MVVRIGYGVYSQHGDVEEVLMVVVMSMALHMTKTATLVIVIMVKKGDVNGEVMVGGVAVVVVRVLVIHIM